MTRLNNLLADPHNAGVWSLVPERSRIGFRCRSFWGLLPVTGRFTDFSGDGQLGSGTAFGRVDIAAASLTTGIGKRDEHLRSEDYFAVERFPTISVVVTAVQPDALRSTLTVRGVTRQVELPAVVTVDDNTVHVSVRGDIDRTQWGVSGNLLGMVKPTATLTATAVFLKTG